MADTSGSSGQIGEAFIRIRPDASQFGRELNSEVQKAGSSAGELLRDLLAVGGFVAATKTIISSASELEQAVGGTVAVFGEASQSVETFARGAADAAGLSERAARQLTSQLGGLLKGFGFTAEEAAKTSVQLTQLGADLAATFGGRPEEAVQALGAALRGEFDPLERFGISLNVTQANLKAVELGLASSTSQVDLQARAQASLAIIMERSADAQGQFAREANTAQGQMERARAQIENSAAAIGESLLPVVAKAAELVGVLAGEFADLPSAIQLTTLAMVGLVAVGPRLAAMGITVTTVKGVIETLALQSLYARDAMTGAGNAATTLSSGLRRIAPTAVGIGITAAALAGLGEALFSIDSAGVERYFNALQSGTGENLVGKVADDLGKFAEATRVIKNNDDLFDPITKFVQGNFLGGNDAVKIIDDLDKSLKQLFDTNPSQAASQYNAILERLNLTVEDGQRLFNDYNGAVEDAGLGNLTLTRGTEDSTKALEDQAEAAKEVEDRFEDLLDATNNLFNAQLDAEEAGIKIREALESLNEVYADGASTADDRARAELDVVRALEEAAQVAVDTAEAQATLEGRTLSAAEKADIQREALVFLAGTLDPNLPDGVRARVNGLVEDLDKIQSKNVQIVVDIQRRFNLDESTTGGIQGLLDAGLSQQDVEQLFNRASGGPVRAGTRYRVGERDAPELFRTNSGELHMIPGEDGMVIPGSQIGADGGGTWAPVFNITTPSPEQTAKVVIRKLRMTAALAGGR